jgi:hypothetical protein
MATFLPNLVQPAISATMSRMEMHMSVTSLDKFIPLKLSSYNYFLSVVIGFFLLYKALGTGIEDTNSHFDKTQKQVGDILFSDRVGLEPGSPGSNL